MSVLSQRNSIYQRGGRTLRGGASCPQHFTPVGHGSGAEADGRGSHRQSRKVKEAAWSAGPHSDALPGSCLQVPIPLREEGENSTPPGHSRALVYCPDPYSSLPPKLGQGVI